MVYLSTTGVYGAAKFVDENTAPDWTDARARPRLLEEERVRERAVVVFDFTSGGDLRPGARRGTNRCAVEATLQAMISVSRVHVDDLAAHAEAALLSDVLSDVRGAYPVADEQPATTREVAEFCSNLLNIRLPGK